MLQKQGYPQIKAIYASFFFYTRSKAFNVFGPLLPATQCTRSSCELLWKCSFLAAAARKTSINGWSTKPTKLLLLARPIWLFSFFLPCCISAGDFSPLSTTYSPHEFLVCVLIEKPSAPLPTSCIFCSSQKRMSHGEFLTKVIIKGQNWLWKKSWGVFIHNRDESFLHD